MNYSDDQEEKPESLSVETSAAAPPNGESKPIDAPGKDDEEERPKSPPAINRKENQEGKSEASNADETTATVEQPPQINFPRPPPQSLERAVSYKQAVFEKAIRADVVSMSDLRRLGWSVQNIGKPLSSTMILMMTRERYKNKRLCVKFWVSTRENWCKHLVSNMTTSHFSLFSRRTTDGTRGRAFSRREDTKVTRASLVYLGHASSSIKLCARNQ